MTASLSRKQDGWFVSGEHIRNAGRRMAKPEINDC